MGLAVPTAGAAGAPTGGANRVAVWNESAGQPDTEQVVWNRHVDSPFTGSIQQKNLILDLESHVRNPLWKSHLATYLTLLELNPNTTVYEDGTVQSNVQLPPAAYRLLAAHVDGELDGSRLVTVFRFAYSGDTGSHGGRSSGTLGEAPLQFTSIPASNEVTVSSLLLFAAFGTDIFTTFTVDFTFGTGEHGTSDFINVTTGVVTTP